MESKDELRRTMKLRRGAIPKRRREAETERALKSLSSTDVWRRARTIVTYVSFGSELSTGGLVERGLREGRVMLAPRVRPDGDLDLCPFAGPSDLAAGAWGILEPVTAPTTDERFDLLLVPGLAFDREGYRLGYGGGYYDRLMARIHAHAVGLGFSVQEVPRVPRDPWDHPLDAVLLGGTWLRREEGRPGGR